MVTADIKKLMHNMLYVTVLCIKEHTLKHSSFAQFCFQLPVV